MHFNFDPTNIDLARPGEAFLKSAGFLLMGNMFEGLDINNIHMPPIILELAKFCAYMGAGVAFFKFVINIIKNKPQDNQ